MTHYLSDAELVAELDAMNDDERRHFENELTLRAYVRGWTGDPLCQPIESVRAAYAQMRQERGDNYKHILGGGSVTSGLPDRSTMVRLLAEQEGITSGEADAMLRRAAASAKRMLQGVPNDALGSAEADRVHKAASDALLRVTSEVAR